MRRSQQPVAVLKSELLGKIFYARCVQLIYREFQQAILINAYAKISKDLSLPFFDCRTIHRRIKSEGISFASKTLPLLSKALDRGLADGKLTCPTNFHRARTSALPVFLGSLFRSIFYDNGVLRPRHEVDVDSVRKIRLICNYAYKADYPRNKNLDDQVISRFRDTEEEVARLEFDSNDPILKLAASVVKDIFRGFRPSDIICRHGPGVTSNVPISEKFEHKLTAGLPVYSLYGKEFFFNHTDSHDRLNRYPVYTNFDYFGVSKAVARVILVNKDSRGPRLISCEPCENQFVQQGISRWMIKRLESHPLTSGQVNFVDQSINRSLACDGSLDEKATSWATLDLKDASDRNSLALTKILFSRTDLVHSLLVSRSHSTDLFGERVLLSKFAPMGSALCFPVMACNIFVLLYVAFIGIGISPDKARNSIFVYGDDIIVPSNLAAYAGSILERYGFKVNEDKSFSSGIFRESCGGDYCLGQSVTPVRLRKVYELDFQQSAEKWAAKLVWHANELDINGLHRTSEYYYSLAEEILGPLPYGQSSSPFLCRYHFGDNSLVTFFVENVQKRKSSFRAWVVKPIESFSPSTVWGHLSRVIGMLGQDLPVPKFGVFSLPKRWKLVPRKFNCQDFSW